MMVYADLFDKDHNFICCGHTFVKTVNDVPEGLSTILLDAGVTQLEVSRMMVHLSNIEWGNDRNG